MADEVFEVYLRDNDGDAYHIPFREGLERFLSDDGYRITINIEGVAMTLRKGANTDAETKFLDDHLAQISMDCLLTVRGLK